MGQIHGTRHNNPQYETDSGVLLDLRPLGTLAINKKMRFWIRDHPRPEPPIVKLENNDPWPNVEDAYYKLAMGLWHEEYSDHYADQILTFGVMSEPPPDWVDILELNLSSPKLSWIYTILDGPANDKGETEVSDLVHWIMGITDPTPEAVEHAQKN